MAPKAWQYSANWLNTGMLAQLIALREQLDDLMVKKIEQKKAMQFTTLSSYTSTGMSIWVSSDEAKYNDCIIYNTPSGTVSIEPTV